LRGCDGRIDDPKVGWKGRGLWVTSGNRTPVHVEGIDAPHQGAPGTTEKTQSSPLVVHFQLRPDALAQALRCCTLFLRSVNAWQSRSAGGRFRLAAKQA
jgi:hypothetical protein